MFRQTIYLLATIIALTACYGEIDPGSSYGGTARSGTGWGTGEGSSGEETSEKNPSGLEGNQSADKNPSGLEGNQSSEKNPSGLGEQSENSESQSPDPDGNDDNSDGNDANGGGGGTTPPPPSHNHAPTGVLDSVSGGAARGWACDKDTPSASVQVHIYVGGPAGSGATGFSVVANRASEGAVAQICGGGNAHRFAFQIPNWQAFANQPVYAYAIDTAGGHNSALANTPQALPAAASAPAPAPSTPAPAPSDPDPDPDPAPAPAPSDPAPAPAPSNPAPGGTDALQAGRRCAGVEQIQWYPWGNDKGDAADRASCAAACTAWAKGQGLTQWCCRLYQDSQNLHWVCRGYASHSLIIGWPTEFAGLGQSQ